MLTCNYWHRTWSRCCVKQTCGTFTRRHCCTWKTSTVGAQKQTTLCRYHGSAPDTTDAIRGSVRTDISARSTPTPADTCATRRVKTSSSCWWRSMRPGRATLGALLTSATGSDLPVQFSPTSGFLDVESKLFLTYYQAIRNKLIINPFHFLQNLKHLI